MNSREPASCPPAGANCCCFLRYQPSTPPSLPQPRLWTLSSHDDSILKLPQASLSSPNADSPTPILHPPAHCHHHKNHHGHDHPIPTSSCSRTASQNSCCQYSAGCPSQLSSSPGLHGTATVGAYPHVMAGVGKGREKGARERVRQLHHCGSGSAPHEGSATRRLSRNKERSGQIAARVESGRERKGQKKGGCRSQGRGEGANKLTRRRPSDARYRAPPCIRSSRRRHTEPPCRIACLCTPPCCRQRVMLRLSAACAPIPKPPILASTALLLVLRTQSRQYRRSIRPLRLLRRSAFRIHGLGLGGRFGRIPSQRGTRPS